MIIYLFRDKDTDDIFALSTDVTGTNIPLVTQTTDGLFQEGARLNRIRQPLGHMRLPRRT